MDLDREFIASLTDHDVRYLVVGGYALAAHGLPRATGDLDAWVWIDPDNALRILASLAAFGFGALASRLKTSRPPAAWCSSATLPTASTS